MTTSGPDMSLDFVPSADQAPRLTATATAAGNSTSPSPSPSPSPPTMRGLLPWPMSQFDSIPVYSLCYSPPPGNGGGGGGGDGHQKKQSIEPLPCPIISHFNPTQSKLPPPAKSPKSSMSTSQSSPIPDPPTTASHASSLDICTTRACRDLAQFAHLNAQALGKYPWLVDQGTRAAAAGGARDACALASCPHAYHAFTATVCVPLSHPELRKRGARLDKAPKDARADLAALLDASVKAPDRDVAPGLGVCLSAMPLGSACNPDVVVVNPTPAPERPVPLQGNGTLHANRLPAAFQPPAWATDADLFKTSDFVSGALIDGQLFVSSLWPLPRTPASSLPPQLPRTTPPTHPIWSPVYSLTTCGANKTTVQAQMPGEPCTSTAQCAMSPCVDPLNNWPITPGGNVTGQCSRRWMSKANMTVSEQEYSKALDAAQGWEATLTWITVGLLIPAFLLLTFASMCGTERVWKTWKERRRRLRAERGQARPSSSRRKPKGRFKAKAKEERDVELGEHRRRTRISSLDRAHLEQLRVLQEIVLSMRVIDPPSVRPKSTPLAAHTHPHPTSGHARSASTSAAAAIATDPPLAPQSVLLAITTPPHSTLGSLPRPHIPPRANPPAATGAHGSTPLPAPAATTANAPHIPRPRFAAPAVTSGVPSRPVIPPRLQNASIPVGGGARPSGQSVALKPSS